MNKPFFVVDTNTFISAQLIQKSVNAQAYDHALVVGQLAVSEDILNEYLEVLHRPKFDRYLSTQQRQEIIERLLGVAIVFKPDQVVAACRDPKDNKFLELALSIHATCLISGDSDLLVLHPFRDIPIVNATYFLQNY